MVGELNNADNRVHNVFKKLHQNLKYRGCSRPGASWLLRPCYAYRLRPFVRDMIMQLAILVPIILYCVLVASYYVLVSQNLLHNSQYILNAQA